MCCGDAMAFRVSIQLCLDLILTVSELCYSVVVLVAAKLVSLASTTDLVSSCFSHPSCNWKHDKCNSMCILWGLYFCDFQK